MLEWEFWLLNYVIIERCFNFIDYTFTVFFHSKHIFCCCLPLAVGPNCSFLFAADSFVVNQTWGQPSYSKGLLPVGDKTVCAWRCRWEKSAQGFVYTRPTLVSPHLELC